MEPIRKFRYYAILIVLGLMVYTAVVAAGLWAVYSIAFADSGNAAVEATCPSVPADTAPASRPSARLI